MAENKEQDEVEPGFNVKFHAIAETTEEKFLKIFTGTEEGLMRSEPGGFVMPPFYCDNAESIFRLKPQKGDVWLLSFPKTGKSELINIYSSKLNSEMNVDLMTQGQHGLLKCYGSYKMTVISPRQLRLNWECALYFQSKFLTFHFDCVIQYKIIIDYLYLI